LFNANNFSDISWQEQVINLIFNEMMMRTAFY